MDYREVDRQSPAATALLLAPGDTFAGFRVREPLAHGAHGEVYRAVGPEGADVALKILRAEAGSREAGDARERFRREGQMLARLEHRSVVGFRGQGALEDQGIAWIALELVEGQDLEGVITRCPGRRLSPAETVFVLERLASALAHAHERKIFHRDIKPSNVLITEDGLVKLTDFGLGLDQEEDVRLTAHNAILGTPWYMAPEVIRGREYGSSSDIYALGAMTFRLLAARHAFPGKVVPRVIKAHLTEQPPPLRELAPETPERLAALVSWMLAKEGGERPTAAMLLEELERAGLHEETTRVSREWARGNYGRLSLKRRAVSSGRHPARSSSASDVAPLPPAPAAPAAGPGVVAAPAWPVGVKVLAAAAAASLFLGLGSLVWAAVR